MIDILALLMLGLAAQQPDTAAATQPDLEIGARIRARRVTIERQGEARLTVSSSPDGGNLVDVRAPDADGQRTLRNVVVDVKAEARIGDPLAPAPAASPDF